MIVQLTDDVFADAFTALSPIPKVIKFWAPWCAVCKTLDPTLNSIAADLSACAEFYSVDLDSTDDIALHYGIRTLPTIVVINKTTTTVLTKLNNLSLRSDIIKLIET